MAYLDRRSEGILASSGRGRGEEGLLLKGGLDGVGFAKGERIDV